MEYHSYNSLNRTIKEQYERLRKNETKEDKIMGQITDIYNNPSLDKIKTTTEIIKTVITPEIKKEEEKKERYLYIHNNYI